MPRSGKIGKRAVRLGYVACCLAAPAIVACGSDDESIGQAAGTGGASSGGLPNYNTGGLTATGGFVGQGGIIATGGATATGGTIGSGGLIGSGGVGGASTGGLVGSGGASDAAAGGGAGASSGGAAGAAGASTGGAAGASAGGGGGTAGGPADAGNDASTNPEGGVGEAGPDASSDGAGPPICTTSFTAIALTGSQGTVNGSAQGDTSDAVNRIGASACDGASKGAGPDLVYSFTLDRVRDVTVAVTAGFDAILRSYVDPCGTPLNGSGGDACANAGAGNEQLVFPSLPAGTYYVAVDGAGSGDSGTFTVSVSGVCSGVDQLRLVELGIGTTDYAVIRNMSDCPAELGGVKVFFDDSAAADLTTTLPTMTLPPGGELRIQEGLGASVPGAIDAGGSIPFQYDRGGTVRLCKSDCSKASDLVDVLMFADGDSTTSEPPPPPPSPVQFTGPVTGITQGNQNAKSWVRVGSSGRNPSFVGTDWCTGEPGAVFGLRLDEVFLGEPDYIAIKNHADCVVSLSPFRATLVAAGSSPVNAVMDSRNVVVQGRVFVSEPPAQSTDINTGVAIQWQGGRPGTVQLCRGACSTPGNTIDVMAFDGTGLDGGIVPYPPLPGGLVFLPDGLMTVTAQNQNTTSYIRAALGGRSPRFLAADWKTGAKTH